MNRAFQLLAFAALTFISACATPTTPNTSARPTRTMPPDAALTSLVEEYFNRQLELYPTFATSIGEPGFDDRLDETTSADFRARVAKIEQDYLSRVQALDANALSPVARLTRDIFVTERELALEGMKFPEELMPFDQMNGLPVTLAVYGSGSGPQPFATVADYDRFLKRLRAFPRWADGAIALMRTGMARGITIPRAAMAKTVPQLREIVAARPQDSVFWGPMQSMPKSFTAADVDRLTREYTVALRDEVLPAYARLADFVEKDYLPAARATVGWTRLPEGDAWYRWRVKTATTLGLAPEEIHAIGLAEVARIRGEMTAVKERVGFKGDLEAFFKFLETDPQFFYTNEADLIAAYQDIKRRIDALLPKLFVDFPKADYEVRPVEAFRAASAAGASYQAPSADGKRPGIFYINTHNLKAQPKYGLETLSIHEAAPGHHFQIAIQQELPNLPRFRKFNNYVAYAEGWALYAESIGKELGVFTDPYQWYGRLSDEMLRAMRLVVDTGLHAKGWTREQAIQYMLDNSSLAESDVTAEVERYIVWPGQALGYKLGQLHITKLRALAAHELGAAFDVREFHSQVLRDGAVPMDVLTRKIDQWIAAKRPRAVK